MTPVTAGVTARSGQHHRSPTVTAPTAAASPAHGRSDGHPAGALPATEPMALLLWEACRRGPDPAAFRRALTGGADIERAVAATTEHRIAPLLWRPTWSSPALTSTTR